MKYKKIFITGGAGFIGRNIIEKLKDNNQIKIYDLVSGQDLLDLTKLKRAIKNYDIVFHLAANADIAKSALDPSLDLNNTTIATFNVLEAMRASKIKHIVFNSGSGVYGDQGATYTDENFGPLLPTSMYGASKLGAEGLISAYCSLYGLQSWIFRPANVVGRYQTHGVAYDFINKLNKNPEELKILGNGKQSKSYIYIDDCISAMFLAIKKSKKKVNLFNIASQGFTTVNAIAKIIVQEMGLKNVKFKYTGGRGGWKGDIPVVRLDTKSIRQLGWKEKFNSNQAVQQSVKDLIKELLCK